MPFFSTMSASELIVRCLPLAVLVLSGVFCGVSGLRERARRRRGRPVPGVYPGSREQAGDQALVWWRSLSSAQQSAVDAEVLARAATEESAARVAEESAARTHSLYRA